MAEKPRLKVPKEAKKGEVIEIKTLIVARDGAGQRKDRDGNMIPRKIINKFTCEFNGKPVFSADIEPAVAANPYLSSSPRSRKAAPSSSAGPMTTARSPRPKKRSPSRKTNNEEESRGWGLRTLIIAASAVALITVGTIAAIAPIRATTG